MLLRVERRFSQGLSFLGAYTWSKSIDDASSEFDLARNQTFIAQNSHDLAADRGLSGFHTKHRLVWSGLYELHLERGIGGGLLRHLLDDWQIGGILTLQTGQPFTINRLANQSRTGIAEPLGRTDRPDQIADPFRAGAISNHPNPACHSTVSQGGRAADVVRDPSSWFNPCAFASPLEPRFGNAGRNSVIGPGLASLDFSLLREVPLRAEGHRLQLRFEFFNLTNHPNFDLPDRIFDSAAFSRVQSSNLTGLKPPRQIQFGVRYMF